MFDILTYKILVFGSIISGLLLSFLYWLPSGIFNIPNYKNYIYVIQPIITIFNQFFVIVFYYHQFSPDNTKNMEIYVGDNNFFSSLIISIFNLIISNFIFISIFIILIIFLTQMYMFDINRENRVDVTKDGKIKLDNSRTILTILSFCQYLIILLGVRTVIYPSKIKEIPILIGILSLVVISLTIIYPISIYRAHRFIKKNLTDG